MGKDEIPPLLRTLAREIYKDTASQRPRRITHRETGEVWIIERIGSKIKVHSYEGPTRPIPKHLEGPQEKRMHAALLENLTVGGKIPIRGRSTKDFEGERNARALLFEAQTLEKAGKYEEALSKYAEAISVDEKLAKAWFHKFKLHFQLAQMDEALDCATKTVELDEKWKKFIKKVDKENRLGLNLADEEKEIGLNAI